MLISMCMPAAMGSESNTLMEKAAMRPMAPALTPMPPYISSEIGTPMLTPALGSAHRPTKRISMTVQDIKRPG